LLTSLGALRHGRASASFCLRGLRLQNWSLRPNWMMRADSPVWMTFVAVFGATVVQHVLPNCEEVTVGEPTEALRGLSKFGWLKALNISVRNWNLNRFVRLTIVRMPRYTFQRLGTRT